MRRLTCLMTVVPSSMAPMWQVRNLVEIEAIQKEKADPPPPPQSGQKPWRYLLTPLGFHLAYLPVDVRIGKVGEGE